MDYYFDVRDKTINIESKGNHLQNLSDIELDKCMRIKHIIQNPDF